MGSRGAILSSFELGSTRHRTWTERGSFLSLCRAIAQIPLGTADFGTTWDETSGDNRRCFPPVSVLEISVRGAVTEFDVIDWRLTWQRIAVKGSALTVRRLRFKLLLVSNAEITPELPGLKASNIEGDVNGGPR